MNLLRVVVMKELRDIVGSTKFAVTFGASALLILLSFAIGARNHLVAVEQYEAAKRENVRKLEGITDWIMVRDYRVFLPPQPIASIVNGISHDIGRTADIRGRGEINAEDNRYGDEPVFAVFRFIDLDFIYQIVLSLFAILFGYDAISGEKERGTLRLSFANAVPRSTFILGKIAGSALGLVVPLLVPLLLGALVMIAMGVPMTADDWLRLSLVNAAGLIYFLAFLSLSIFVSALTQRSANAFLLLLTVWVLAVMVWPRAAVLIAGRAVDVPGVDELNAQKGKYNLQLWEEDRTKMADYRVPQGQPADQSLKEFQKFMSGLSEGREKKMAELTARLNEDRANRQAVQERVALGLARLSPSAVVSLLNMSIAGTGLTLKQEFKDAAETYQRSYGEFIKQKTGMNPGGGFIFRVSRDTDERKPINANEIPPFLFEPSPLRARTAAIAVDAGILALFSIVFFAGAVVAFVRYDVR